MNKKTIHKLTEIISFISLGLIWVNAIVFYQQPIGRLLGVILSIICFVSFYVSDYTAEESIFF